VGPFLRTLSIFAMLTVWTFVAGGQSRPQPPSPSSLDEEPIQGPLTPQEKLGDAIANAVIGVSASGTWSIDSIENMDLTLTLAEVEDFASFQVTCSAGGEPLKALARRAAATAGLDGDPHKIVCGGAGRANDPYTLRMQFHIENGRSDNACLPQLEMQVLAPEAKALFVPNEDSDASGFPTEAVPLSKNVEQTSHATMTLPEGWTTGKLPEPIHASSAFGTVDDSVTLTDGVLTADRKIVLKADHIAPADMESFGKWMRSAESRSCIAVKSTSSYPDSAFDNSTPDKAAAGKAMSNAWDATVQKKFDVAETELRNVESLQPDRELLHHYKAMLAEARGDHSLALKEYQLELQAFPSASTENESIAKAQGELGLHDEQIQTLEHWMATDHNTMYPALQLMGLYHRMKRDDLAVRAGDEAMNLMGKDARNSVLFLLEYGRVQMSTGQVSAAQATLEHAIELTDDIEVVNDAAYLLSEQGLDLPRAEEVVRESLKQYDTAGDFSRPHLYSQTPTQATSLLLASWDTLGWILFHEDKVEEAEGFIHAAWVGKQDPAIALHLGKILTREGQVAEALDVYALGLASIPKAVSPSMADDPDAVAIRAVVAEWKTKARETSMKDPAAKLKELRRIDVGKLDKPYHLPDVNVVFQHDTTFITVDLKQDPLQVKTPAGMFPKGSNAAMTRKGALQCAETCTLTLSAIY
jgi:tetratricopeptide (TPR) repeat protein